MASEDDLVDAAHAAEEFLFDGEEVVGVLAADPFDRGVVFLCALGDPDDEPVGDEPPELGWVAIDASGQGITDASLVREAASLVALCETAEEAALVPESGKLSAAADRAIGLAGPNRPALTAALVDARDLTASLATRGDGVSVAQSRTLDELAAQAHSLGEIAAALKPQAQELSGSLSGTGSDANEPLAQAVWTLLTDLSAAGRPEAFSSAISGATGAIEALADDVIQNYRLVLDGQEDHKHE